MPFSVLTSRAVKTRLTAYGDAVKACPTQRMNALQFLNAFKAMCERVRLCVLQREELLKDLDYRMYMRLRPEHC